MSFTALKSMPLILKLDEHNNPHCYGKLDDNVEIQINEMFVHHGKPNFMGIPPVYFVEVKGIRTDNGEFSSQKITP